MLFRTVAIFPCAGDNYEDPGAVARPYLRQALDALLSGRLPEAADTTPVGCTIKWK